MIALDSINKLEKYNKVFDIEYYKNNKNKILGKALKYNRDKLKSSLYGEIIDSYKKNKSSIPFTSYFYSLKIEKSDIKRILPKSIIKYVSKKKKSINDRWTN